MVAVPSSGRSFLFARFPGAFAWFIFMQGGFNNDSFSSYCIPLSASYCLGIGIAINITLVVS